MKRVLIACIAAGMLVSPATVLVATSAGATECAAGVPQGYQRPGGYCDTIALGAGAGGSITEPVSSGGVTQVKCDPLDSSMLTVPLLEGERIHVAASAGPDCPQPE